MPRKPPDKKPMTKNLMRLRTIYVNTVPESSLWKRRLHLPVSANITFPVSLKNIIRCPFRNILRLCVFQRPQSYWKIPPFLSWRLPCGPDFPIFPLLTGHLKKYITVLLLSSGKWQSFPRIHKRTGVFTCRQHKTIESLPMSCFLFHKKMHIDQPYSLQILQMLL